jgi:hypothetical protein
MEFHIDDEKLAAVCELVREYLPDTASAAIEEFITADWHEGQEHQDWLDEATANEIADWVIAGLR